MILIIIIILPTNERAISSLEQNDHVKYLGVMIDDKISRKYHISFFFFHVYLEILEFSLSFVTTSLHFN